MFDNAKVETSADLILKMVAEIKRDLICDGELEVVEITADIHDEVVEFYKTNFLKNENVSIACELLSSELAVGEVEAIVRVILKDGFGYGARHCTTKELVAICVNAIVKPENDLISKYQFQSPGVLCGAEFVKRMKGSFDLLKEWNIDCAVEIVFLSTRNDFGGRGLAGILSERSVEFARQMLHGNLPEKNNLPAEIKSAKPQAVCSIFTSLFTQKVGEKLGMETHVKIPFTEFFYEGKSFAEKIKPIHQYATYAALRLK